MYRQNCGNNRGKGRVTWKKADLTGEKAEFVPSKNQSEALNTNGFGLPLACARENKKKQD